MREQSWLNIKEMRDHSSLVLMWKALRQQSPWVLYQKIYLDDENYIYTDNPILQHTSRGFRWRTCTLWNNMPQSLRDNTSLPRFKI